MDEAIFIPLLAQNDPTTLVSMMISLLFAGSCIYTGDEATAVHSGGEQCSGGHQLSDGAKSAKVDTYTQDGRCILGVTMYTHHDRYTMSILCDGHT